MSKSTPTPLTTHQLGMNELRQPTSLTDLLKSDPYALVSLERYGNREGVALSPQFWELIDQAMRGDATLFSLEPSGALSGMKGVPHKLVAVRARPIESKVVRELDVWVDWVQYTLTLPTWVENPKPAYDQILWRHHPDVAQEVIDRFPWNADLEAQVLELGEIELPENEIVSSRFPYPMTAWSIEKSSKLIVELAKLRDTMDKARPLEPSTDYAQEIEEFRGHLVFPDLQPTFLFAEHLSYALDLACRLYEFAVGRPGLFLPAGGMQNAIEQGGTSALWDYLSAHQDPDLDPIRHRIRRKNQGSEEPRPRNHVAYVEEFFCRWGVTKRRDNHIAGFRAWSEERGFVAESTPPVDVEHISDAIAESMARRLDFMDLQLKIADLSDAADQYLTRHGAQLFDLFQ